MMGWAQAAEIVLCRNFLLSWSCLLGGIVRSFVVPLFSVALVQWFT